MPADFTVEVNHELDKLVDAAVAAIVSATQTMADELRETHIPAEAPVGPSGTLSDPRSWVEHTRGGGDPLTRIVRPGTDAFYAHIVAGGRGGFGPTNARALTVEDRFVASVGPAAANPFHERALARVEDRAADILAAALAEEGIT